MRHFFGDFHNMDKNIITYMHRPFKNIYEMRDSILHNINSNMENGDELFLLGDLGDPEFLNNIVFDKIIIILGNHDDESVINETIKTIPDKHIEIYKYPIMVNGMWLSHEPITYLPPECPYLNVHAHTHLLEYGKKENGWVGGQRYLNASADILNFRPILEYEIEDWVKENKIMFSTATTPIVTKSRPRWNELKEMEKPNEKNIQPTMLEL